MRRWPKTEKEKFRRWWRYFLRTCVQRNSRSAEKTNIQYYTCRIRSGEPIQAMLSSFIYHHLFITLVINQMILDRICRVLADRLVNKQRNKKNKKQENNRFSSGSSFFRRPLRRSGRHQNTSELPIFSLV